jgi:hypothetical protein
MAGQPEIHHIGHPFRSDMTCCGIPMPKAQFEVRHRGPVEICDKCMRHFKNRHSPERFAFEED